MGNVTTSSQHQQQRRSNVSTSSQHQQQRKQHQQKRRSNVSTSSKGMDYFSFGQRPRSRAQWTSQYPKKQIRGAPRQHCLLDSPAMSRTSRATKWILTVKALTESQQQKKHYQIRISYPWQRSMT